MLSSAAVQYTASPEYASKLAEQGSYSLATTFKGGDGKTYTHNDVHEAFEEAYLRHRGENLQRCGGSNRDNKKIRRKWKGAVEADVKDGFHLSWATIGFAVLLTVLGGPLGFIIAVVTVLFEYYLTRDLGGDTEFRYALLCARS